MSIRFLNPPRPGPRCLAITLIALVIDAALLPPSATCSLQPQPRYSPQCGAPYWLARSNGVLRLTEEPNAELAGTLHVFLRSSLKPHFWAPLTRQWSVSFTFTMIDDSIPTPAQISHLGADIANSRAYPKGLHRSLFESNGGVAIEPLTAGLLHNTFAASAALLALASISGTARAYTRKRRIARQLCAECAYSRQGLSRETPCPECACIPGNHRRG